MKQTLKKGNGRYYFGSSLDGLKMSMIKFSVLSIIVIAGFGCSKDDEYTPLTPKPPVIDEEITQYGTPFENVPNTSDITKYEVNISAFSAGGDLPGVEARLDEIKELGINVVWLMPIYPIGSLNGVGSPYAVKNYTQVNPAFGSLDNLRSLVEEAHERDMAVILDWVGNHTAWDHPWIAENPQWYTRDASGNITSPEGMGWPDVADLNFSNNEMRNQMIQAMKYWVLEANVDGYRCDYAEGLPTDFWKQAIDSLRAIPNRDIIMFAEAANKNMFSAGFDLIFGWDFYHRLKEVYNDNNPASRLIAANTTDYNNVPEGSHILRWIDNHDDNAWENTPQNIFDGQEGTLAAFVVTSYMGGVPLIYNGQEVGYPNQLGFFEGSTTKIDWSVNPEILTEYQQLMAFRNSSHAVRGGQIEAFPSEDVVAFKRISGSEEVVVLVNVRDVAIDFELPESLAGTTWQDAFTDSAVIFNDVVSLEPYAYMILKK